MQDLEKTKCTMLSSKRISDKTGKEHKTVLRDIRHMLETLTLEGTTLYPHEYQVVTRQDNGQTAEILLNERLSLCLASGYSIVLRVAIIDDWAAMKAEQMSKASQTAVTLPTRKELALMVVAAEEKIELLEAEVKELSPKAESFDTFISTEGLFSNAEAAKMLGTGQNRLCALFRKWNVYNSKNIPYQRYIDEGCFEVKISTTNGMQFTKSMITQKGLERLRKKFNYAKA